MSRRRALERHLKQLTELGEIMRSMKNLALIEQRKIAKMAMAQTELIDGLTAVAADFLAFHPDVLPPAGSVDAAYVLFGSQRGFCGDFNQAIQKKFKELDTPADSGVIAVGDRLHMAVRDESERVVTLNGPSVCEEVERALNGLLEALDSVQRRKQQYGLFAVYHDHAVGDVVKTALLPPFQASAGTPPPENWPPILNLDPRQFWSDLVDQYLFSKLHHIFYVSLLAENQRRVEHMTGAVQHLEEKTEILERKSRALRLEAITEEIEVILLGAGLDARQHGALGEFG